MKNYSYSEYSFDIQNKTSTYTNKVDINKADLKEAYSDKKIKYKISNITKNEQINIYDDIKKCSSNNNNTFYIDDEASCLDITNLSDKEIKNKKERAKKKNILNNKKCILSNGSNIYLLVRNIKRINTWII